MGSRPLSSKSRTRARLRENGAEFGATTGRPRRCGWLDAVMLNYAVRLNGVNALAITKLDVLTGMDKVKICVGYEQSKPSFHVLYTMISVAWPAPFSRAWIARTDCTPGSFAPAIAASSQALPAALRCQS